LEAWSKTHHPIFASWFAFSALPEKDFQAKAKELSASFATETSGTNSLNPAVAAAFADPPISLKQVVERYGKLFSDIDKQWRELLSAETNHTASANTTNSTHAPTLSRSNAPTPLP